MPPLGGLFSAQLGQTNDPKELVPGSPRAIFNAIRRLREQGSRFEATADDLGRVRTPGWFGEANNAFWDKFSPERLNWLRAADAMNDAAAALTTHAEVLASAQRQAAEAIELWERGEAATWAAQARHDADVARVGAQNRAATVHCLPGETPAQLPVPVFTDPGEKLRKDAQEVLDRARRQLNEAGVDVVGKLRDAAGQDRNSPSWLSKAGAAVDTAMRDHETGQTEISDDGWKTTLAKFKDDRNLWNETVEGTADLGPLALSGKAGLKVLGAGYEAEASLGSDGLEAEIEGEAYLVKTEFEGKAELGLAEATVTAEAMAGAEADAELGIGPEGVNVAVEAFAGGKAEVDDHFEVAGLGVGYTAGLRAGAGINGDFTAGMHDGKLVVGGEFGAALGFGGGMGGYITIDPHKVAETVNDAADAVGDAVDSLGTVGNLVRRLESL